MIEDVVETCKYKKWLFLGWEDLSSVFSKNTQQYALPSKLLEDRHFYLRTSSLYVRIEKETASSDYDMSMIMNAQIITENS